MAEDHALEHELLADEKERAEHVMLVDLGRNDLGRVCVTGTVQVDDFMTVERYSHVMHIVSRVSGELEPGRDMFDVLRGHVSRGHRLGRAQDPRHADHHRPRAGPARPLRRRRGLLRPHAATWTCASPSAPW